MSEDSAAPVFPGSPDREPSNVAACSHPPSSACPDADGPGGVVCAHLGYQAALKTARGMGEVALHDFLS